MSRPDEGAVELAALLRMSRRAVVFTGAGISTESGIPDFRSPGGIWTKMMPIDFGQFVASKQVRQESWRRRFEMEKDWMAAKPNAGHSAVAELVRRGMVTHVITQNIDNLHQDSGVPAEKVIELHGNTRYARCLSCNTRYEISDIRAHFEKHGDAPDCKFCGGIVKTATISFGQAMPEDEMERAQRAALACDLMLVIGSSLVVYPAAGFPLLAKRNGAAYAILNREVTDHEAYADLSLHGEIGPTMSAVLAAL
ncbi:MAG: Sir2 family NAD-dependent protein deacetylase [Alphaproteobacteria bacterium]|nr:Sir2 family NAD-dependent protein deacetylase [Alphaproteobacteria bacterium]MBL6936560.1 Sir2 family NAD-dependent protein deacetylase [Alphaproteobacteria bacterium]MBL7098389.1 Sir2 family NAD-dependent protein deacetylase [Alphaproteobacteria bacterium]